MTIEPRPTTPVVTRELRASVRRQASSLSGGLLVLLAGLVGVAVVLGFVVLDYRFNQDTHRLVKIAIGLPVGLFIALQPMIGLLILPVSAPFLLWLPELPVPGLNTLNIMLLSIFGMWALMRVLSRQSIGRRAQLMWPIAIFVMMMIVSLIRGAALPPQPDYDVGRSALILFRTATTFTPYFIALLMVRGSKDPGRLFGAIVVALIAEVVTTIWFGQWGGARAKGSMGQPNVLGSFLNISTVLVGSVLLAQRRWFPRLLLATAVIGGAYATLLTISRGAMIALSVGLLYVAVRSSRLLTVLILLTVATSPVWAPDSVKERVSSTQQQDEESDDVELEGSAQARVDTWKTTLKLASDHLVEGLGFDGLGYVLRDTGIRMGLGHTKDSTHNTFLRVVGDMGLPGLLLFLFLLWSCWMLGQTGIHAAQTRFDRQLAVGLQGGLLAVMINCWFGDRFFELDIMCAFWLTCALVNDFVNRAAGEAT